MSKSDIWQFSPVDANNTDIEGIDVNTGWAPNQVGPSFRALMGRLARVCQGLAPWLGAVIDGAAATARGIYLSTAFTTAGSAGYRWFVGADATAETGSNAGSDLTIVPYSDAGSALATAITVARASGGVILGASVTVAGGLTATGNGGHTLKFSNTTCLGIQQSGASVGTGIYLGVTNTTSYFEAFYFNTTPVGAITTNGSSTIYATTSDYRLKTTFGPSADASILSLPVHDAAFTADIPQRRPMLLAHEVASVAPEAVHGEKDAVDQHGHIKPQMVDYSQLVPRMISAMRVLEGRISALEAH